MNKPGQIVRDSGIYKSGSGQEAALSKGDRFPPTAPGKGWTAVRLTRTSPRTTTTRNKP
jgi:hypothetical protein